MLELMVDFNNARAGNLVSGLLSDASREPVEGEWVRLHDGDDICWGHVKAVSEGRVEVEVDWDTWGATEKPRPQGWYRYNAGPISVPSAPQPSRGYVHRRPVVVG